MPDIKSKLAKKLKAGDTAERCGFITKAGKIIEMPNVHPTPELGFKIDPVSVIEALEQGHIGTWHTHPTTDPNLSGEDYGCFCAWDNLVHYIIGRRDGEVVVTEFTVDDGILIER